MWPSRPSSSRAVLCPQKETLCPLEVRPHPLWPQPLLSVSVDISGHIVDVESHSMWTLGPDVLRKFRGESHVQRGKSWGSSSITQLQEQQKNVLLPLTEAPGWDVYGALDSDYEQHRRGARSQVPTLFRVVFPPNLPFRDSRWQPRSWASWTDTREKGEIIHSSMSIVLKSKSISRMPPTA